MHLFPGIYAPCILGEHKFIDGGVLDNSPTKEVRRLGADKVISVKFKQTEKYDGSGIYSIILRTAEIMTIAIADDSLNTSDIIIEIDTGKVSLLGIEKINQCKDRGYEETIRRIESIKEIII